MEEQLISFETAKSAKKKGFDIPTRDFHADWEYGAEDKAMYNCSFVGYPEFTNEGLKGFGDIILIPTQSILQKWLREKHNLHPYVVPYGDKELSYSFASVRNTTKSSNDNFWEHYDMRKIWEKKGKFKTYEKALEYGLQEALKLI